MDITWQQIAPILIMTCFVSLAAMVAAFATVYWEQRKKWKAEEEKQEDSE